MMRLASAPIGPVAVVRVANADVRSAVRIQPVEASWRAHSPGHERSIVSKLERAVERQLNIDG